MFRFLFRLARLALIAFLVLALGLCVQRNPQRAGSNVRKAGSTAIDGAGKVADSTSKFMEGLTGQ